MQRRKQCGQICLLFTGIVLICFGSTIFICFDSIYDFLINYILKFSNGTIAYTKWEKSPPVLNEIYLFNWTNADQITNYSVIPEFEEIGPYRFHEVKGKANVTWHEDYVNYVGSSTSYFDEKKSLRKLNDVITTINFIAVSITYQARLMGYWAKKFISFGLSSKISELHVTKTAGELLFDGYDDSILGILSKIPFISSIPKRGGFFVGRNGTPGLDGTYSMQFKNDENFGKITKWNGKNQSDFFRGQCNDIKGSAGEFFPLNRQRDEIVIYSSELCKHLSLKYVGDVEIKGVKGYKYSAEYGFDNGTIYPENECYCSGECVPTGVFNISTCRMNSPTFLSFPHFFNADPIYGEAIKGMKPNKTKHEFYMILEPKSGIIMEVQAGMQLNMLLQPIPGIRLYEKVPKLFIPVLYMVRKMDLTEEYAWGLRILQKLPEYSYYIFYVFIILGCISLSAALCCIFKCGKSNKLSIKKIHPIKSDEQVPLNEKIPQWRLK